MDESSDDLSQQSGPDSASRRSYRPYSIPIAKEEPWSQTWRAIQYRVVSPITYVGPPDVGKNCLARLAVFALERGPFNELICSDVDTVCDDCIRYLRRGRVPFTASIVSARDVAHQLTLANWDSKLGLFHPLHYAAQTEAVTDLHLLDAKEQIALAAQISHAQAIGDLSRTTRFFTACNLDALAPDLSRVLIGTEIAVPLPSHEEAVYHLGRALDWAGVDVPDDTLLEDGVEELERSPRKIAQIGAWLLERDIHVFNHDSLFRYLGRTPRKGGLTAVPPEPEDDDAGIF